MKGNKITLLLVIIALILPVSCEDYLDVENKGKIDQDNIYDNINNLELILAGVYSNAASKDFENSLWRFGEATSDNVYLLSEDPSDQMMQLATFRYTPDNDHLLTFWESCYEGINRANSTLNAIESLYDEWEEFTLSKPNSTLYEEGAETFSHIGGEAKFWRAFFYFNLVRTFGKIPIQAEQQYISSDSNNFYQPRAEVLEVYDYIEKDLREAILTCRRSVDITNASDKINAGRVTKGAATAYLMKALGYKAAQDPSNAVAIWEQVAELGDWITNTGGINYSNVEMVGEFYPGYSWSEIQNILYLEKNNDLYNENTAIPSPADAGYQLLYYYDMLFRVESEFCSESVLEINHSYSGTGEKDDNVAGTALWATLCDFGDIDSEVTGASKEIRPSTYLADVKKGEYKDHRIYASHAEPVGKILSEKLTFPNQNNGANQFNGHIAKYLVWPEHWSSNSEQSDCKKNVCLMRYAEVLLWYAEALNETGRSTEAIDIVNQLRERGSRSMGNIDPFNDSYNNSAKKFPQRMYYLTPEDDEYTAIEDLDPIPDLGTELNRAAIWHERDMELLFEFDRFYDLVRTGQAKKELDNFNQKNKGSQFRLKLFVEGKHELFAIPQEEINKANGKWTQNPGH